MAGTEPGSLHGTWQRCRKALETTERLRTCLSDPGRFLGPTNYSQHTHHSQIVICNHFWQHHEQEQRARPTAVFHVGSVILLLHLSQAACPGWAGGVTQPQGSLASLCSPGWLSVSPTAEGMCLEEMQTTGNGNSHECKAALPEVPLCLHTAGPVPHLPRGWGSGTR